MGDRADPAHDVPPRGQTQPLADANQEPLPKAMFFYDASQGFGGPPPPRSMASSWTEGLRCAGPPGGPPGPPRGASSLLAVLMSRRHRLQRRPLVQLVQ